MNDLSLFLYFADVVGSLNTALIALALASAMLSGFMFMYSHLEEVPLPKWAPRALVAAVASLLLSTLVPSRNTMYAIAASELGEQVVTSDTGKKIASALEAWLDKQLEQVGK